MPIFISWSNILKSQVVIAIISAVIGSLVTVLGAPIVEDWLSSNKEPLLLSEISKPSLNGLEESVQDQIKTISTTFSAQHTQGSSAEKITLIVKGTMDLDDKSIAVSSNADTHKIKLVSPTEAHIDFPAIRPTNGFSVTIIHSPQNQITFDHLIDNGKIVGRYAYEQQNSTVNNPIFLVLILFTILALLIVLMFVAGYYGAKNIVNKEEQLNEITKNNRVFIASIIIGAFVYNVLIENLSDSLPLPELKFSEVLCAVLLYLLLSNYDKLKAWLNNV